MNQRIFIKPAPMTLDGEAVPRVVRKPTGTRLDQAGEEVNLDTYWRRRLNDGDVVEASAPKTDEGSKTRKADAPPAA